MGDFDLYGSLFDTAFDSYQATSEQQSNQDASSQPCRLAAGEKPTPGGDKDDSGALTQDKSWDCKNVDLFSICKPAGSGMSPRRMKPSSNDDESEPSLQTLLSDAHTLSKMQSEIEQLKRDKKRLRVKVACAEKRCRSLERNISELYAFAGVNFHRQHQIISSLASRLRGTNYTEDNCDLPSPIDDETNPCNSDYIALRGGCVRGLWCPRFRNSSNFKRHDDKRKRLKKSHVMKPVKVSATITREIIAGTGSESRKNVKINESESIGDFTKPCELASEEVDHSSNCNPKPKEKNWKVFPEQIDRLRSSETVDLHGNENSRDNHCGPILAICENVTCDNVKQIILPENLSNQSSNSSENKLSYTVPTVHKDSCSLTREIQTETVKNSDENMLECAINSSFDESRNDDSPVLHIDTDSDDAHPEEISCAPEHKTKWNAEQYCMTESSDIGVEGVLVENATSSDDTKNCSSELCKTSSVNPCDDVDFNSNENASLRAESFVSYSETNLECANSNELTVVLDASSKRKQTDDCVSISKEDGELSDKESSKFSNDQTNPVKVEERTKHRAGKRQKSDHKEDRSRSRSRRSSGRKSRGKRKRSESREERRHRRRYSRERRRSSTRERDDRSKFRRERSPEKRRHSRRDDRRNREGGHEDKENRRRNRYRTNRGDRSRSHSRTRTRDRERSSKVTKDADSPKEEHKKARKHNRELNQTRSRERSRSKAGTASSLESGQRKDQKRSFGTPLHNAVVNTATSAFSTPEANAITFNEKKNGLRVTPDVLVSNKKVERNEKSDVLGSVLDLISSTFVKVTPESSEVDHKEVCNSPPPTECEAVPVLKLSQNIKTHQQTDTLEPLAMPEVTISTLNEFSKEHQDLVRDFLDLRDDCLRTKNFLKLCRDLNISGPDPAPIGAKGRILSENWVASNLASAKCNNYFEITSMETFEDLEANVKNQASMEELFGFISDSETEPNQMESPVDCKEMSGNESSLRVKRCFEDGPALSNRILKTLAESLDPTQQTKSFKNQNIMVGKEQKTISPPNMRLIDNWKNTDEQEVCSNNDKTIAQDFPSEEYELFSDFLIGENHVNPDLSSNLAAERVDLDEFSGLLNNENKDVMESGDSVKKLLESLHTKFEVAVDDGTIISGDIDDLGLSESKLIDIILQNEVLDFDSIQSLPTLPHRNCESEDSDSCVQIVRPRNNRKALRNCLESSEDEIDDICAGQKVAGLDLNDNFINSSVDKIVDYTKQNTTRRPAQRLAELKRKARRSSSERVKSQQKWTKISSVQSKLYLKHKAKSRYRKDGPKTDEVLNSASQSIRRAGEVDGPDCDQQLSKLNSCRLVDPTDIHLEETEDGGSTVDSEDDAPPSPEIGRPRHLPRNSLPLPGVFD